LPGEPKVGRRAAGVPADMAGAETTRGGTPVRAAAHTDIVLTWVLDEFRCPQRESITRSLKATYREWFRDYYILRDPKGYVVLRSINE